MNFQEAVVSALSKYATFTGRAGRSEFWWFWLFGVIIQILALVLDILLFDSEFLHKLGFAPIRNLVALALFVPFCAVIVRRLQDTGRSLWWAFLLLIPIIGILIIIYYLVQKGEPEANRYGEPWSASGSEDTESGVSVELESSYEKTERSVGGLAHVKVWKIVFSLAVIAACAAPFATGTWEANPQSDVVVLSMPSELLSDEAIEIKKIRLKRTNNCQSYKDKDFIDIPGWDNAVLMKYCLLLKREVETGYGHEFKFSLWMYLGLNFLAIAGAFIGVFVLASVVSFLSFLGSFLLSRYWTWLRNLNRV